MPSIPQEANLDRSFAFRLEGYAFVSNRCRRYGSDLFQTRIMLSKAVCMMGAEAAEEFYRPGRFTRRGAMPKASLTLLQDFGSVMLLDDENHRHRKQMFLSIVRPDALRRLGELTADHWRARTRVWQEREQVALFHEAHVPLASAVCEWAGLSLTPREVEQRAQEFEAMVEGAGSLGGPRNWRGHLMRARAERWSRAVIQRIRAGEICAAEGSAAMIIASHRDRAGDLLDLKTAAVELINVLRPTVANARFLTFAALALHQNPEWRVRVAESDEDLEAFVQEVRRFYPFFPIVAGRVLAPFEWRDHRFRIGDWVLLDLYGTNHDPRIWGDPEGFRPERFKGRFVGMHELIPQGGGDQADTHRCPGESITVEQMKAVTRLLVRETQYEVPEQDLSIELSRIPAVPNSRFVMRNVRQV